MMQVSTVAHKRLVPFSGSCQALLLVELSLLEFHPGPLLRSVEAGERLGTRQ